MSPRGGGRRLTLCVAVVTMALAGCGENGDDPTALPAATATPPAVEEMPPAPTSAPLASPPPTPRASPSS